MTEACTALKQKAGELETAIDQTRSELARLDKAQRSEAHRQLVEVCNQAADWLHRLGDPSRNRPDEEAASLTREAQSHLVSLRSKRSAI